jgi:hypothetical protein
MADVAESSVDLSLSLEDGGRRGDWVLVEDGAMKGMNVVVDQGLEEIISLSTRQCRDTERWKEMPALESRYLSLQCLDLDSCRYLVELDASIGSLKKLRRLYLTRCDRLERIPSSVCLLENLEEVYHLFLCWNLWLIARR